MCFLFVTLPRSIHEPEQHSVQFMRSRTFHTVPYHDKMKHCIVVYLAQSRIKAFFKYTHCQVVKAKRIKNTTEVTKVTEQTI